MTMRITKKIAVFPGSFDPITNGHIDIINRAKIFFDEVIIVILVNSAKKGLFSVNKRCDLIDSLKIENLVVDSYNGLLASYLKEKNLNIVIRGIRNTSDFNFEFDLGVNTKKLNNAIEFFYLFAKEPFCSTSSSLVREIAMFKGELENFVPFSVEQALKEKFSKIS